MEEKWTHHLYQEKQTDKYNTKPKWIQCNGNNTKIIQNGETLFYDDTNLEYYKPTSILPKIKTYDLVTNNFDLEISRNKVQIIKNNNINKVKNIITKFTKT